MGGQTQVSQKNFLLIRRSRRMGSCRAKAKIQRTVRERQWEPFTQGAVASDIKLGWRQVGRDIACLHQAMFQHLSLLNISNFWRTTLISGAFVHIVSPQENPVPWKLTVNSRKNYRHEYMGATCMTFNIPVHSETAKQMRLTWVVNSIYSAYLK